MMFPDINTPPPSYKSYKNARFEKYKSRIDSLCHGVRETSLKDDDKKKLYKEMQTIIAKFCQ